MSKDREITIQQAIDDLGETIRQSTVTLCTVHEPHLFTEWHEHTCGECGWASVYKSPLIKGEKECFDCRRTAWQDPESCYLATEPACPAFVERPKEEE